MPDNGQPTHADLLARLERVAGTVDQLVKDVGVMMLAQQRDAGLLKQVHDRVGEARQDDRGDWIGTGLAGDFVRLRKEVQDRFKLYDKWTYTLIGGAMAVSLSIAAFWWAVKPKIEALIHGG